MELFTFLGFYKVNTHNLFVVDTWRRSGGKGVGRETERERERERARGGNGGTYI